MEKNYTVFEHAKRGTRFFTGYSTNTQDGVFIIVKHCETSNEAQECCYERHETNMLYYAKDMAADMRIPFMNPMLESVISFDDLMDLK